MPASTHASGFPARSVPEPWLHGAQDRLTFRGLYLTTINLLYCQESSDEGMRLLVTGSRHWPTVLSYAVEAVLYGAAHCADQRISVTEGACRTGADRIAADVTRRRVTSGWRHRPVPAQWIPRWRTLGVNPGHQRNQAMVDAGQDVCVGWPHPSPQVRSRGTWDCLRRAQAAGIPTFVVAFRAGRWDLDPLPT